MLLLLTTYPNKPRELKKFIVGLVQSRIAVCVQKINYMKSYYIWEGKFQQNEEKLLLIKLHPDNKAKIEAFFSKNHPYKTPEMIRIQPDAVNASYLERVASSLS